MERGLTMSMFINKALQAIFDEAKRNTKMRDSCTTAIGAQITLLSSGQE
jgi:hypothetical protein